MTDKLAAIDRLIVQGQIAAAQAAIERRLKKPVTRAGYAPLAALAWRAGIPEAGLRLLRRVVKPELEGGDAATDLERAEYAQCLIRIGAAEEGEKILSRLDPRKVPRVHLYRAGLLVSR